MKLVAEWDEEVLIENEKTKRMLANPDMDSEEIDEKIEKDKKFKKYEKKRMKDFEITVRKLFKRHNKNGKWVITSEDGIERFKAKNDVDWFCKLLDLNPEEDLGIKIFEDENSVVIKFFTSDNETISYMIEPDENGKRTRKTEYKSVFM